MRRQLGLADVLADTGANDAADGGALAGPDASAHLDRTVSRWPVSSPTRAAPTPRAAVSDGARASYLHTDSRIGQPKDSRTRTAVTTSDPKTWRPCEETSFGGRSRARARASL